MSWKPPDTCGTHHRAQQGCSALITEYPRFLTTGNTYDAVEKNSRTPLITSSICSEVNSAYMGSDKI